MRISAGDSPALSVSTSTNTYLALEKSTNITLADSESYTRTGKSTIHSGGAMLISGYGNFDLTSNGGHGILKTGYLRIFGGNTLQYVYDMETGYGIVVHDLASETWWFTNADFYPYLYNYTGGAWCFYIGGTTPSLKFYGTASVVTEASSDF